MFSVVYVCMHMCMRTYGMYLHLCHMCVYVDICAYSVGIGHSMMSVFYSCTYICLLKLLPNVTFLLQ